MKGLVADSVTTQRAPHTLSRMQGKLRLVLEVNRRMLRPFTFSELISTLIYNTTKLFGS